MNSIISKDLKDITLKSATINPQRPVRGQPLRMVAFIDMQKK
jgi:hypothetical protein